jgi:hypothetical protein
MGQIKIEKSIKDAIKKQINIAEKAKVMAINKAIKSTRTAISKFIRAKYKIKKSDLDKFLRIIAASYANPKGKLEITDKPIPLIKFNAKQTSKGVTYSYYVGGGRKHIKSAFIQTIKKTNYTGVFKRKGKEKYPIEHLYGPSVWVITSEEARNEIRRIFEERYAIEYDRALKYLKGTS